MSETTANNPAASVTPNDSGRGARHFVADEVTFSGKFSGDVFATVRDSFRPFAARIVFLFGLGPWFVGGFLLSRRTVSFQSRKFTRFGI